MAAPFKQPVISPDVLARVGKSLYGGQWQTALARDLDISERSVRYFITGERAIHAGIVKDLLELVEESEAELHEVAKVLRKAVKASS